MAIMLIAGKGGISGIAGDPLFGNPSPIVPMIPRLMNLNSRVDHMDYDEMPDLDRLAPDSPGQPTLLIAHSFGAETAIALAGLMPRLASQRNWLISEIAVILLDGVHQSFWWTHFRPRFDLPSCVTKAMCFVRDAIIPPYSSIISGDNGESKRNYHRPDADHNSIVAIAEPLILDFACELFTGRKR